LRPRSLSAPHRSMLPWALDRHGSDAAALSRRPDFRAGRFASRFQTRFGVPDLSVEGRQGVSALSGSCVRCSPSSRRSTARRRRSLPTRRLVRSVPLDPAPKGGPRPVAFGSDARSRRKHISAASQHGPRRYGGMPVDPPRGENPPRRSAHPKALGVDESRRVPEGTRSRSSERSEERRRWFELTPLRPSAVARVHDGRAARRTLAITRR